MHAPAGYNSTMTNRVLLISGSRGIAAETAKLGASRGRKVFFVSRNEERCQTLADEIESAGGESAFTTGDLAEPETSERTVEACLKRFGRIDALYNVAGISARKMGDGPIHKCSVEAWDLSMQANVRSLFLLTRATVAAMLDQDPLPETGQRGVVLNMSSIQAVAPAAFHFETHAYATSKAAIIGLTRTMAAHYARDKIRVNAIAPAVVKTPLTARAQADPVVRKYLEERQALTGGILDVEGVAELSLFLLGDGSRHLTGEVISPDGGWRYSL